MDVRSVVSGVVDDAVSTELAAVRSLLVPQIGGFSHEWSTVRLADDGYVSACVDAVLSGVSFEGCESASDVARVAQGPVEDTVRWLNPPVVVVESAVRRDRPRAVFH